MSWYQLGHLGPQSSKGQFEVTGFELERRHWTNNNIVVANHVAFMS
jgi:hypothetical protein